MNNVTNDKDTNGGINNDDDDDDNDDDESYYANLGVRKGLLLIRYVLFMKEWIKSTDKEKKEYYPTKLKQFAQYFETEMGFIKDDALKQEIDIIDKLINW